MTARLLGWRVWALAAVLLALAGGCVVVGLYARGGGDIPGLGWLRARGADPLAASGPEEVVLRTVRLAGYDRAAVSDDGGRATVAIEVPGAASAAEVDLARQTGFAVLSVAYPRADAYRVQLVGETHGEVTESEADGDAVREAVEADDAAALRAAAGAGAAGGSVSDE